MTGLEGSERIVAGRYVLIREIGRGGMATVSLARDLEQDSLVAVKMLREDIASSVNTERFLREVGVASALTHPHILPLLDSGRADDGLPFYVMPYVVGETLRQRLETQRQLPVDEALEIVAQVAEALAFAHERGVLHRDVTPANILLDGTSAYLSDFGIARAIVGAGGETLTSTGVVIGTPEYMSPEQGAGDHGMDSRGDLFSLASVLYTALAGEPPYTGPTPQSILARKATARAPSVLELRPLVPPHVARAIARGLEPVPADRFRSMREFAAALAKPDVRSPRKAPAIRWLAAGAVALTTAGVVAFATGVGRDAVSGARREMDSGGVGNSVARLRAVVAGDSTNGNAALWLAQGLLLSGEDTSAEWRRMARRAAAQASAFSRPDGARAAALGALALGQYDAACPAFRSLRAAAPTDLTLAFDLATCIVRDRAVLPDAASPSGFRFRASWNEAKQLFAQLIEDLPADHEARAVILRRIPRVLRTEWGDYRDGRLLQDSSRQFWAFPTLVRSASGDSIQYAPYPITVSPPDRESSPGSQQEAIESDRAFRRAISLAAVRAQPNLPEAHLELATALELSGSVAGSASDSGTPLFHIRAARRMNRDPRQDLALRVAEVRVLVKREEFPAARALADSTIARWPTPERSTTGQIGPLLALTGRGRELASHLASFAPGNSVRMPDGRRYSPHPVLGATTLALHAYAAVGGPRDSLLALNARAERELRSYAPAQSIDSVRTAVLARSLSLAVPSVGPGAVTRLSRSSLLLGAQQALARGERKLVGTMLDSLRESRSGHTTAAARIDQVYHEAWLRVAIGDAAGARRQLDDALEGLPALGTFFLSSIPEAGAFPLAMLLRADLAGQQGDSGAARRWSSAARSLLRSADGSVQPN